MCIQTGGLAHPFWGKYKPKEMRLRHPWFFKGGHHERIPLGISVYRFYLDDVTDDHTVFYGTVKIQR
jgi:hypothetical protein